MKRKLIILFTVVLSLLIVGCSNKTDEQYNGAIADGKSKVIEEQYDKAIEYFKLALEYKADDKEATNLIEQIELLEEAISLEVEGAYFKQIENLDKISSIETESDVVKEKAEKYRVTVLKNIEESINQAETHINNGEYDKAREYLEPIIEESEKSECLKDIGKRSKELLDRCNKEEEENKKKAEEEKKKQEEQAKKESSSSSNKAYCNWGHYTDAKNIREGVCVGCMLRRDLSSTFSYEDCSNCYSRGTVSQYTGECFSCEKKVLPAIKKIYDDGTVIYDNGTSKKWY